MICTGFLIVLVSCTKCKKDVKNHLQEHLNKPPAESQFI